jgi:hypothetical protein
VYFIFYSMNNFSLADRYSWKYWVYDNWYIFSIKRNKIMKTHINWRWYLSINLFLPNWKIFHDSVHRLVAECFCERKEWMDIVNHIDWNKLNNHYTNLEWTTASGNMKHSVHVLWNTTWLTVNKPTKWKLGILARDHKKIIQKDKKWNFIKKWDWVNHAARELWMQASCISNCCTGKRKTSWWYTWSFAA